MEGGVEKEEGGVEEEEGGEGNKASHF